MVEGGGRERCECDVLNLGDSNFLVPKIKGRGIRIPKEKNPEI